MSKGSKGVKAKRPEAYQPEAAADAWARTLRFFRERLKA